MRPVVLSHTSRDIVHDPIAKQVDGCSLLGAAVLLTFAVAICITTVGQLWGTLKGRDSRFR